MSRRRLSWAGVALVAAVLQAMSLRRHDGATLSETTRAIYRTHTPAGRALFVASWAGLSAWLVPHICRATAVAAVAVVEALDDSRPDPIPLED